MMLKHIKLLAATSAFAAGFAYARAEAAAPVGVAGALAGAYSNASADCSGCGSTDNWGLSGQGAFGLGTSDLAAEGDVGYANSSGGGFNTDTWGLGGSLFWNPDFGRLGASLSWARVAIPGPDVDFLNYGGFAEFFASDFFTLGGNLGGLHVSTTGFSSDGVYVAGGATGYVMPDLGITGNITYADFGNGLGNAKAYSIGAEWLISEAFPVSVMGGYTYVDTPSGAPNLNVWTVGLKLYVGGDGMPLVGHHRNGSLDSLATVNSLILQSVF